MKSDLRRLINSTTELEGVPGVVVSIQTFGDLVNFNPHLHCLVTDGCFMRNGWFYVLPKIDVKKLESFSRHKAIKLWLKKKGSTRNGLKSFFAGVIPVSTSIIS